MYLKRLEIQGFKSFISRTTLQFNKELTAIVGPNGSGKSNIADAIRWALGEQSLKLLRGKKAEDVIFAGSVSKGKLGLAEVSLALDNSKRLAEVPYDEVIITRRVYRNGESEYLVNGNKVRLQDVLLLLAQLRCGQKSYSVIGQGLADAVVTASAGERKEFFDEATGVKPYQIKRDQAVHKLEQSRENLGQSQTALAELEPRLRSLTRQMDKLQARAGLEEKLVDNRTAYFGSRWQELSDQLKKQQRLVIAKEEEVTKVEEAVTAKQQDLNKLLADDSQAQAYEKWQRQSRALALERGELLQRQLALQAKQEGELVAAGQGQQVAVSRELDSANQQLQSRQEELATLRQRLGSLNERLKTKHQEQTEFLRQYDAVEKELLDLQQQASRRRLTSAELQNRLSDLNSRHQLFVEQLKTASLAGDWAEIKSLIGLGENLGRNLGALLSNVAEETVGDRRQEKLVSLQQTLSQFVRQRDRLTTELSTDQSKATALDEQLKFLENEVVKLEQRVRSLSSEAQARQTGDGKALSKQWRTELDEVEEKLRQLDERALALDQAFNDARQGQTKWQATVSQQQGALADTQTKSQALNQELNLLRIDQAKLETHREELEKQIQTVLPASFFDLQHKITPPDELNRHLSEIQKLEHQLELIGGIDPNVATEYAEVKERHGYLHRQVDDLVKALSDLEQVIANLDRTIEQQFQVGFAKINKAFGEYFKILFNGGQAKLLLEQKEVVAEEAEEDEEQEEREVKTKLVKTGIDIQAVPPGKKMQGLSALSGGEKALTAIALICAIISNQPSPFVLLDEVDAALDEANSARFAKILETLQSKSQVIAITHNRATMHQATVLYGVTMGEDGASRLLSLSLTDAQRYER